MPRKSWSDKMAAPCKREVKPAPKRFADIAEGELMLLTAPQDVAAMIATLKEGEDITVRELRERLAKKARADKACPVVTGIHLRTVAEHAGEQLDAGVPAAKIVPVWRVMPKDAAIWTKLENGRAAFRRLRKAEGLEV